MALVWIPPLLRRLTGGREKVVVPGETLGEIISNLEAQYPGIKEHLLDEEGHLQASVAVAIDGETTTLGVLERVREDSEVHFIPAISGGS